MIHRKSMFGVLFLVALAIGCSVNPEEATQEKTTQTEEKLHLDFVVDENGWESVGPEPEPDSLPVAQTPVPPGFPEKDEYSSHTEACTKVIQKEVPKKRKTWQRAIMLWCEHRNYHASRYKTVKSRVDGSQIHDRDRPTAWIFYK